jgi:hypothetical protein
VGPAFLAATIPVLQGNEKGEHFLHPVIERLVDEFGERQDVQNGIAQNIYTFGWTGSTVDYFRRYFRPFGELTHHSKGTVRRWAKNIVSGLEQRIETDKQHDDERDAFWGN